ncbi:alpha/beta hydrolase fold domain-containing protein [uncultured Albimonas sp.]|uniref:alpha/beta hydrolase n=1 Tax=uncultured Albimonas sp. TaxID=1331701 RepID=UPI0030EE3F3A|tara:strand:- start:1393 stop:2382 length:990 start_codon:yes stop_codon:yes gene_type:complete
MPLSPRHEVVVEPDIVYGHALRRDGAAPESVALELDLYRPAGPAPDGGRAAVLLAFGGAFHRGSRQDDGFADEAGRRSTAMAEYCRMLAGQGYVAASLSYRLAQLRPDPGPTQAMTAGEANLDRIQVVRGMLGLAPIGPEEMREAIEGGIDDVTAAYRYLAGAARRHGVDPSRIVLGGFSAGARLAISAALTHDIDPAGVICLSGAAPEGFARAHREAGGAAFPVLLVTAEDDLPAIRDAAPGLHAALAGAGLPCVSARVPGHGHFYPASAPIEGGARPVLIEEIMAFLERAVGAPGAGDRAVGSPGAADRAVGLPGAAAPVRAGGGAG